MLEEAEMQHDGFDPEILALQGRARVSDLGARIRGARRDGPRTVRPRRWAAGELLRSDLVIARGR